MGTSANNKIRCFLLEPTGEVFVSLRRYRSVYPDDGLNSCPADRSVQPMSYHDARVPVDILRDTGEVIALEAYADDPRWPSWCACGYAFTEKDNRQVFQETIYRRADNGEEWTLREAPVGAMWRATWMEQMTGFYGPDGQSWIIRCPGTYDWSPDQRASNCDSPCMTCGKPCHLHPEHEGACKHFVESRVHHCWCRHGTAPLFTVDKNGVTCWAGGGSILVPGWHGFLREGFLVTA